MSSNRRACFHISNAHIFDPLCSFLFVMRLLSSIFISFTAVYNLLPCLKFKSSISL